MFRASPGSLEGGEPLDAFLRRCPAVSRAQAIMPLEEARDRPCSGSAVPTYSAHRRPEMAQDNRKLGFGMVVGLAVGMLLYRLLFG